MSRIGSGQWLQITERTENSRLDRARNYGRSGIRVVRDGSRQDDFQARYHRVCEHCADRMNRYSATLTRLDGIASPQRLRRGRDLGHTLHLMDEP
jgi:hypothetical protein